MTRYPKNNKSKKWTPLELNAVPNDWNGDTLSDGGGLSGTVRVKANSDVSVRFQYVFRIGNKTALFQCGSYPTNDMTKIRANRDEAKRLVSEGLDPRVKKLIDKILNREEQVAIIERDQKRKSESLTIKDMFDVWFADGVKRSDGNKFINQEFNNYVIPVIGKIEVRSLTENHLIKIYKDIVASGKNATALELSKDVKQMLTWCEKRKPWRALLVDGNPALLVEINKILPDDFTKVRDRVLSYDEIIKLKSVFDGVTENYLNAEKKYETERPLKKEVQLAMWICLSTVCRIGELLMTEWKHVDFRNRNWFIPAVNTKGTKKKKTDHNIYLSEFALNQFKQLHELTGDTQWAFPARYTDGHVCVKSASKQVGDRQVMFKSRNKKLEYRIENNTLVLSDKAWTPHDLRRTGATFIQNLVGLQYGLLLADLCLHHNVVTGSLKHYVFDDYADEMKKAWIKLGDRLQSVLNADNLGNIKKVGLVTF